MSWNTNDFDKRLGKALNAFDWAAAQRICDELIDEIYRNIDPFPESAAKALLTKLRRKQRFELMTKLAEAFISSGLQSPQVLRQYAQSLIDRGILLAPEFVLNSIIADSKGIKAEEAEAWGLIGRIYKQLYINADASDTAYSRKIFKKALDAYSYAYNLAPQKNLWHGINVAALLKRAQRDGFTLQDAPNPNLIAEQIIQTINERERQSAEPLDCWDIATLFEALIASGDYSRAEEKANVYSDYDGIDAFELGSTLRQLKELWQLTDDKSPGDKILPVLRAALLSKNGGAVTITPHELRAERAEIDNWLATNLQANFGARAMNLRSYRTGLERCESIARIERLDGQGHGTGWLVNAGDFFPGQDGRMMLLTNAHVVSPDNIRGALRPEQAQVSFQTRNEVFEIESAVWSSSPAALDATFLILKGTPNAKPLPVASYEVKMGEPTPRLFIIGHPLGGELQFSLEDNLLLGATSKLLHYRTLTEKGSSGSPVFDDNDWRVVALHHAGSKTMRRLDDSRQTYEANEGISIQAIKQATHQV